MSEKPENANEDCVGPSSERAGKADGCNGCPNQSKCSTGAFQQESEADKARDKKIKSTFSRIKQTILVLSGKGGVGKSTCSAQLAFSLCKRGYDVGLLDVDICGPSVPLMLGLRGQDVHQSSSGWSPVYVPLDDCDSDLAVMSVGFLVSDEDSAIIWRGPKKNGLIEQFLTSVDWGELDFLIVDTPPGTSDEHISLVQLMKKHLKPTDGAVIVSTPQQASLLDVRKEINFCITTKLPILGVIENMSRSLVPLSKMKSFSNGNEISFEKIVQKYPELAELKVELDIFNNEGDKDSVKNMSDRFNVDFLGSIPLDKDIQASANKGKALSGSTALNYWNSIIEKLLSKLNVPAISNGH